MEALIIALCIVIRICFVICAVWSGGGTGGFFAVDSAGYLELADNLYFRGSLSDPLSVVGIICTPLYPLFIFACYLIWHSTWTIIVAQIGLAAYACWLVSRITMHLGMSARTGHLASLLYSIEPIGIFYSSLILTETLFSVCVLMFVYFAIKGLKQKNILCMCFAGIYLAAAIYTRPILYYFPFILLIIFILFLLKKKFILSRLLLPMLSIAFLLIGLWHVRNLKVYHYGHFSAIQASNLYYCLGAGVILAKSPDSKHPEVMTRLNQELELWRGQENNHSLKLYFQEMQRRGLQMIFSSPFTFFLQFAEGWLRILLEPGTRPLLRFFNGGYDHHDEHLSEPTSRRGIQQLRNSTFLYTSIFLWLVLSLYLISLFGVFFAPPSSAKYLIIALFLYLLFVSGGYQADARFRHPMMPFLSMFSAVFISKSKLIRTNPLARSTHSQK